MGIKMPRADGLWVALATALAFSLGSLGQWQERWNAAALHYEAWQLDELPLTLITLSLGLAWYAWRRRREAARLLAHNQELARQLIAVQENERRALARELHDEMAQHCTAIRLEAAFIERCREIDPAIAAARRAGAGAQQLQQGVRRLLKQLRPAELDELGLAAALQALCDSSGRRGGLSCRFSAEGLAARSLGEALDTAVYRIAQEALANVLRHAGAAWASVRLRVGGRVVELTIEDGGHGFDPQATGHGLGLLGARERAAALGGRLQVHSAAGAGTRLCLQLPLAAAGAGAR